MRDRPALRRAAWRWVALALLAAFGCEAEVEPQAGPAPAVPMARPVERLAVEIVAERSHQRDAFTQGLVWHDGWLYESTGHYGVSELRQVEPETGLVFRRARAPEEVFAEGLERVGDRLIQLTWKEGRALVYRLDDLEPSTEFAYVGEGWGLCSDGSRLIMSDGSSRLQFRSLDDFSPIGGTDVLIDGRPLGGLNELECVDGKVYANLWPRSGIVRIDPSTGLVDAVVDVRGLLTAEEAVGVDVLNGIAYDPERDIFLITGKLWPKLFEVRFVPFGG